MKREEAVLSPEVTELMRRHGSLQDYRTATVIVKSVETAMLSPHEMGLILSALVHRICRMAELEPEFESLSHDLSESCEEFTDAENKRDERLYEQAYLDDQRAREAGL